jgi:P-type Ca2+ transporter type 2C
MQAEYSIDITTVVNQLQTDTDRGISTELAQKRFQEFGRNVLEQNKQQPWWLILLRQFKSPIVYLLIFAAGMSLYFQEWLDAGAIVIVILVNSLIGFYMEFQASRSMEALQKLSTVRAKAMRDGKLTEMDASDIVPGDILFLEAGDMVPADGRLFKLSRLQVNESALTGESVPAEKTTDTLGNDTALAEQTNMLFKGTFVTNGNGWCIVTSTGMKTELGKIANMVQSAKQTATPLEKKLEAFSKRLIQITVVLVVIIFIIGWQMGQDLMQVLNTSIALAVAAIPEGLPIVATLGLARGMLAMARHKVIVKKLSAVETLGGTTVICTDKTGTLTENRMTVKEIFPSIESSKETQQPILEACILCNTATADEEGKEIGDPLEIALLQYAQKYISVEEVRQRFPKVNEEPFSSESKRMLTVHRKDSAYILYAKGALEEILKLCQKQHHNQEALSEESKQNLLHEGERLAATGYKVIGLASKENKRDTPEAADLTFLGMIGLIDPPRPDVAQAIKECKTAGIKVVMITGDHPETAREIARQLGILSSDKEAAILGASMKGYDQLTDQDKEKWLNSHVFARVTPGQKLDLIQVYQEKEHIVGMTGDGVNDAPALKKADIGIAMGQRGTQVAQDVADMVLQDDSFSSIVRAIKQGRVIFDNIRKFVIFLLSCNLSELFTIAVSATLNLNFILLPLQILFINLITDVLPAIALGLTPGNAMIMKQPPRSPREPIIDTQHWKGIIFYSAVISAASIGAVFFGHYSLDNGTEWDTERANNILFFTMIGSQLLHVFNMHASESNFFRSEIIHNRYVWFSLVICIGIVAILHLIAPVKKVLSIFPLSASDWMVVLAFSFAGMVINQLAKRFKIVKL